MAEVLTDRSSLVVEAAEDGLHIAADVLAQAGVEAGDMVQITALPGPRKIQRAAMKFTAWKLGMAIRVGWPEWRDGEWVVELRSDDGKDNVGWLYLDPEGQVIESKSTSRETLR